MSEPMNGQATDTNSGAPVVLNNEEAQGVNEQVNTKAEQNQNISDGGEAKGGNPDAAFAAVRKKAEEKGFKSGFEEGMKAALQNAPLDPTRAGNPADFVNKVSEQIPNVWERREMAKLNEEIDRKSREVGQSGLTKYSDWKQKVEPLAMRASQNAKLSKALADVMLNEPNATDAIYELASNPQLLDELDQYDERYVSQKLREKLKKPEFKVIKAPNPPIADLRSPAGGGAAISGDDKRRNARDFLLKKSNRGR